MDFYKIKQRPGKKSDWVEVYPDFKVCRSKDLMVKGQSFYAVWDEEKGLWSTDEYDVQRLVDEDLYSYAERMKTDVEIRVKAMSDFSSNSWASFRKYMKNISDNAHQLDNKLTFSNTKVEKNDYVSKRLSYPLEKGSIEAYEELIGTLYDEEEKAKLEWAIGAIISGDAKKIQKFIVLYGDAGSGKSTFLNILQKLFEGYYTTFEAKALTSSNNAFSTETFKSNPLVAIQHDGDLSKIEDNTKLNSIISHEEMTINEKWKPSYTSVINSFLFMATNTPVKITDSKSGLIRRLIDVSPSGRRIPSNKYISLMSKIDFELGAIADHCLEVYHSMGKNYYNSYKPVSMMYKTDVFFNFVEDSFPIFKEQNGTTLKAAYAMYKTYCDETGIGFKLPLYKFREELKNYFGKFEDIVRINGKQVRSYYSDFLIDKFVLSTEDPVCDPPYSMALDSTVSLFDKMCGNCPAQYSNKFGTPNFQWSSVDIKLSDLDTSKEHYVKIPDNHIVIDFDLKDESGNKSYEMNMEAASKWPSTYAELSKSGKGVHLHYIYDGDVSKLSRVYDKNIEIKIFNGGSSLRRKLTRCNDIPVATINSGLPLKGEKKVLNLKTVKSEAGLRTLISKNLKKEIHPGTKPSIDFIHKILNDAYNDGLKYDVTDLRPAILAFANNSTNRSDYCVKLVSNMKFKSDEPSEPAEFSKDEIVFYDVEVFPNLLLVNWKIQGKGKTCVRMINPTPQEIEELIKFKLIGFNNRRYDNHILYARLIGYNNEQLYKLSQKLIHNSKNATFAEAYNLSYTDVYDFASTPNKMSLKKWEIELGIHHQEFGLPWDEPVPEDRWIEVAEYCDNDVIATEEVFNHLSGDWLARQILADLAEGTVNDSTNSLTTKIVFGKNRHPQSSFNYRNLAEPVDHLSKESVDFLSSACPEMMSEPHGEAKSLLPYFPGYEFKLGKSTYRGEEVGEGGYVRSKPGMYLNVGLLDIVSMHPHSIVAEILFGIEFTSRFKELLDGRVDIKHEDWDQVNKILNGKLTPYIQKVTDGELTAKELSNALKTAINSVYGLTAAHFDNAFRDSRNIDNIVAKRGALFMVDLVNAVEERGYEVIHVKTDSIKIPKITPEIIEFVMEFGKRYGYTFEHEETYEKFCLVNDAVYIAKTPSGKWTATGAQFAQPYVFKTLFSKEPVSFEDLCETKSVKSTIFLDMNEDLSDDEHNYVFVGKVGSFVPIKEGCGGGVLLREADGKYYAVTGSKGYRWLESETVKTLGKQDGIDLRYHNHLVDEAVANISKYGDFEWFVSEDPIEDEPLPWCDLEKVSVEQCKTCSTKCKQGLEKIKENENVEE